MKLPAARRSLPLEEITGLVWMGVEARVEQVDEAQIIADKIGLVSLFIVELAPAILFLMSRFTGSPSPSATGRFMPHLE